MCAAATFVYADGRIEHSIGVHDRQHVCELLRCELDCRMSGGEPRSNTFHWDEFRERMDANGGIGWKGGRVGEESLDGIINGEAHGLLVGGHTVHAGDGIGQDGVCQDGFHHPRGDSPYEQQSVLGHSYGSV